MTDRFAAYHDSLKQGHMAARRNKPKDALRHYQAAAGLADERAQPHISMARLLLSTGKPREAIAAYQQAVLRAPHDPAVLTGLAEALLAAGRAPEAERMREQASHLANEAAEQSFASAQQSGALTRAEMLHLAGHQARLGGRNEAAIDAWLDEARSHADDGQLDAALSACQEALTISSGSTRIHVELVRLYFRRGWRELAVERLLLVDRLLDLAPDAAAGDALVELARQNAAVDGRLAAIATRASH